MRIGFVGIGARPPRLCARGGVPADSAFAAAHENEVVFTSLPGPTEFEKAMLEPQVGIFAGLRPGAAHIALTSNSPKIVARVGEACRSRQVELVNAPTVAPDKVQHSARQPNFQDFRLEQRKRTT
jgi:3-hydroxyisobutyrate dehydrogenase-like beta-hydroxyacid dehydrogenase